MTEVQLGYLDQDSAGATDVTAHFTLDGEAHVARAGQTIIVPAGVRHFEGNPGPAEIVAVVELRPALRTKEAFP